MTSQKKRNRARRRVERMVDEAYEALAKGERVLADKLSQRAIEEGHMNPRVWLERGRIARELGDPEAADQAFRQAIARAETFAAAFAELARLQASRGKLSAAERLMRRATELAPEEPEWRQEHEAWVAELGPALEREESPPLPELVPGGRTSSFELSEIESSLRSAGTARLDAVLDRQECAMLLEKLRAGDALGHAIEHDGDEGRYTLWFVDRPVAELGPLVAEFHALCAQLTEDMFGPLGRRRRATEPRCSLVAQPESGFTDPAVTAERDAFPLGVEIVLSGQGEVAVVDLRPGRKVRRHAIRCTAGDAVIVCVRERLVRVGGVEGLQSVAVGVEGELTRLALRFDPIEE